jgi:plasmid maintenance system antidote protein VapI
MEDVDRDPAVVIMYLVGRRLSSTEIYEAFGLSRSGYTKAWHEGRLITADNVIRVAKHFDLNPIALLTRFNLVAAEAVSDFVGSEPNFGRSTTRTEVVTGPTKLRNAEPRTDVPAL